MQERRNAGMHPLARKPPVKRKTVVKHGDSEVQQDPFYIDPKTIPKGKAYQWVVTHVNSIRFPSFVEGAKRDGWKPVIKHKPVRGQVLMWAPASLVKKQRDDEFKRAKDQLNNEKDKYYNPRGGATFPTLPSTFVVGAQYDSVSADAPPIDVEVTVKVRMDGRLQDAAAALGLPIAVYAQRRMDLFAQSQISGILLRTRYGPALELHEAGQLDLIASGNR